MPRTGRWTTKQDAQGERKKERKPGLAEALQVNVRVGPLPV